MAPIEGGCGPGMAPGGGETVIDPGFWVVPNSRCPRGGFWHGEQVLDDWQPAKAIDPNKVNLM